MVGDGRKMNAGVGNSMLSQSQVHRYGCGVRIMGPIILPAPNEFVVMLPNTLGKHVMEEMEI